MAKLLAADPELDAVFAANDLMAFGAMRALRQSGRRVPDDVAIVGFDDLPASAMTHPPLTTIRQPLYEMGRAAASMVMAAVRGEPIAQRIELPTSLVIRESSGKPDRIQQTRLEERGERPGERRSRAAARGRDAP